MTPCQIKIFIIFQWAVSACNSSSFSGDSSKNKKEEIPLGSKDSDNEGADAEKNKEITSSESESESESEKQENASETKRMPQKPRKGCQAFFSGCLLGDRPVPGYIAQIYGSDSQTNQTSEWVGEGDYPLALNAFPKANQTTFDGIAFDKGTRVTIYSNSHFTGQVLFDQKGPFVISNFPPQMDFNHQEAYRLYMGRWKEPLQSFFPVSVRHRSLSNMHAWGYGSLKVTCLP